MLHRLERADRDAELLARLRIATAMSSIASASPTSCAATRPLPSRRRQDHLRRPAARSRPTQTTRPSRAAHPCRPTAAASPHRVAPTANTAPASSASNSRSACSAPEITPVGTRTQRQHGRPVGDPRQPVSREMHRRQPERRAGASVSTSGSGTAARADRDEHRQGRRQVQPGAAEALADRQPGHADLGESLPESGRPGRRRSPTPRAAPRRRTRVEQLAHRAWPNSTASGSGRVATPLTPSADRARARRRRCAAPRWCPRRSARRARTRSRRATRVVAVVARSPEQRQRRLVDAHVELRPEQLVRDSTPRRRAARRAHASAVHARRAGRRRASIHACDHVVRRRATPPTSGAQRSSSRSAAAMKRPGERSVSPRSEVVVDIATFQPWPTSPSTWSSGTKTSSKKTSAKPGSPSSWRIGRTVTPVGVAAATGDRSAVVSRRVGVGAEQPEHPVGESARATTRSSAR